MGKVYNITFSPAGARVLNEEMFAGITERLTEMCAARRENELFLSEVTV